MALLDTFDNNFEPKGPATFAETHKERYWHQACHNWITRPGNNILVQKRSATIPHNPNALCVSAAGHFQEGETIKDSPRETKEELGIAFSFNDMTYIGNVHLLSAREIVHVFFANDDTPLEEYQLQEEEVSGIYEMNIDDGLAFFTGKTQTIALNGYKRTESGLTPDIINAQHEDFSTDSKRPWLWMFDKAKRYLNGHYNGSTPEVDIKNPLEIF